MSFDLTDFNVGDEFEGSSRELGIIISSILADGGSFSYEGRSIRITALPNREPAPTEAAKPVQAVTEVAETPEPPSKEEAEAPVEPVKEEPKAPVEPAPVSKKAVPNKTFNAPRKKA